MVASLYTPQNSGARFVIYPQKLDQIAAFSQGKTHIGEGKDAHDLAPRLVGLETHKLLGSAGTWTAHLHVPRNQARAFESSIEDGDWVDLTFYRGSRPTHVMRGILDDIDPLQRVTSNGTDSLLYRLTGRDHQAIFESTDIWFSSFSEENICGGAALRASVLAGTIFGVGNTKSVVSGILFGFLQELQTYGRALWRLPQQMPNGGGGYFAANCARLFDSRIDTPERVAIGANLMAFENSKIWALAQSWADMAFNEIWCDLGRKSSGSEVNDVAADLPNFQQYDQFILRDRETCTPEQTQMAVFFRRRPFPTSEDPEGMASGPWSRLPTAAILPQEVEELPQLRSGEERLNTFEIQTPMVQELVGQSVPLLAPLVDVEDVERRGTRLMRMSTSYLGDLSKGVSQSDLVSSQRRMLVEWHCLNARHMSGTLRLKTLRPGIRVGTVAAVTTDPERLHGGDEDALIYYVEQVRHSWSAPGRGRTELGVTRGFRGSDESRYKAIRQAAARFTDLAPSKAIQLPADLGGFIV